MPYMQCESALPLRCLQGMSATRSETLSFPGWREWKRGCYLLPGLRVQWTGLAMGDGGIMKPRKWNLPLTYKPKIAAVRAGTCKQTIRKGSKFSVGDSVRFFAWTGRPYHSSWEFLTDYLDIGFVQEVVIMRDGLMMPNYGGMTLMPYDYRLDYLAELDGILPATGQELGRVLNSLNNIPPEGLPGQVIRWL